MELEHITPPSGLVPFGNGQMLEEIDRGAGDWELPQAHVQALSARDAVPPQIDEIHLATARRLVRERRRRNAYFPDLEFGEPMWAIVLDLFIARLTGEHISISSACIASGVPPTTALRSICVLVDQGAVHRAADPQDGRRVNLMLAEETVQVVRDYLVTELGSGNKVATFVSDDKRG